MKLMSTHIVVTKDGTLVPLGTGVPVNEPLMIQGLSASTGNFKFPVSNPAFGLDSPLAAMAYGRPYAPGDEKKLPPLSGVTAGEIHPSVWWISTEDHTHLLLDSKRGELVGVSPWITDPLNGFWAFVQAAIENPASVRPGRVDETKHRKAYWDFYEQAEGRKAYFCLHPAPCARGESVPWRFPSGNRSVFLTGSTDLAFQHLLPWEEEACWAYA